MKKIDARKLSRKQLLKKRKLVIELRENGISNKEVSKITGISPQTISLYYSQYKKDSSSIYKIESAGPKKKVWFIKKCPLPKIEI